MSTEASFRPQNRIMAHMVSHYPSRDHSDAIADALLNSGVAAIEVQFPFSDPSADGPAIQQACQRALDAGFRVTDGFRQLSRITRDASVPVYLMSYASIPFRIGTSEFCRRAADSGVRGLIVPDLPVDVDEGLWESAESAGIEVTPVVVSPAPEVRLRALEARSPRSVYVALRRGTTGSRTELSDEALQLLSRLRRLPSGSPQIMAGFGIQQADQVAALMPFADWAVVGSAFVRAIAENADDPAAAVSALARALGA